MSTVKDRFLNYVKYHTTSDDSSTTYPSTDRQLQFAKQLKEECVSLGLSCVNLDSYGYVTAALPSNTKRNIPVIGFLAHMDTASEASGENVLPLCHENYSGTAIPLKNGVISPDEFPELKNYIGDTIITSDGTTLLGADDKAGIAEILTAMEYFLSHPEIPHGTIKIAFTPDEEIGRGVDYFDVSSFQCDFAYTIDGGKLGELEFENFNAARAVIHFHGKSVHPGTAKGVMVNASLSAISFAAAFDNTLTPSQTEGYEGFFHLLSMEGTVSQARLSYLLRDFTKNGLEDKKQFIYHLAESYRPYIQVEIQDEYQNMKEILSQRPEIVALAKKAMENCGVTPLVQPIRGGTDGARLSFMGLPCPNLFTGGHNFHGPYEYIPVSSMEKSVSCIIEIIKLAALEEK